MEIVKLDNGKYAVRKGFWPFYSYMPLWGRSFLDGCFAPLESHMVNSLEDAQNRLRLISEKTKKVKVVEVIKPTRASHD